MTAPEPPDTEGVRAFHHALTLPAYRRFELRPELLPVIYKALHTNTPKELAEIVSAGIKWGCPINAQQVMTYRLLRAAGLYHDNQESDD